MKPLHKGEISLSATGKISVIHGTYPEIEANGENIGSLVANSLGLDPDEYEKAEFAGKITLVIECFDEQPEIKNTITEAPQCQTGTI
jgi:hypothetical protein